MLQKYDILLTFPKVFRNFAPLSSYMESKLTPTYLRVTVVSSAESFVTVRTADADSLRVDYGGSNPHLVGGGWNYLSDLLVPGMQLNLVHPHFAAAGECLPELIIVEPDLLMDITTVAGCMESYADSPLAQLVNRLRPNEATAPILLGNLASQLLDEVLRDLHRPYADSVRAFFQDNALLLATTDIPARFHADAQQQLRNIQRAIDTGVGKHAPQFCREDCIVEPTFFCEMLGLQGRMDMLQQDYSLLVEQKSGKGMWAAGAAPDTPVPQTKHTVQALLYQAILHYGLGRASEAVTPLLLYSKYSNGVLPLASKPSLLFEAFRLRNLLARCEQLYAERGYDVLLTLTPDRMRLKRGSDRLWDEFVRPQLDHLLRPIQEASPLEKAYYLRFLRFVSTEHLLSKAAMPSPAQSRHATAMQDTSFAARWRYSYEEKVQAGGIRADLQIVSPDGADATNITEVTLRSPASQEVGGTSNFRIGDIVVLYPYPHHEVPDLRLTPCLRGSIASLAGDEVCIRLNAPQSTARFFHSHAQGYRWAIEHDFYESSSAILFRGLHAFLSAPKERRDLVLGQRAPRVDSSLALRGDYGQFNELALRVRQAQDFFLIIGPPGTGKTSFGLMTTLREELASPDANVLLLSYTNRAVDEACSKLVEAGIDFVRIGGELTCSEECRPHLLSQRVDGLDSTDAVRQLVASTRVFAATTVSMCKHSELFACKKFSLAIVDEASQILEPHILPLLAATSDGEVAIRKFVFIGDHKQLPAVVQQTAEQSAADDALLEGIGLTDCRCSLFERLLRAHRANPAVVYMLTRQGRMHPDVCDFPNRAFYGGLLQAVPLPHQQFVSPTRRVRFIDAPLPEHSVSDKVNTVEANIIADIVSQHMADYPDGRASIGIIVPYRNQISAIRLRLQARGIEDVTIDTVERYQGSQRHTIIYGFTVQKPYQLDFLTSQSFVDEDGTLVDRKLNVALTRSMERLFLVGHAPLLRRNGLFARLLDSIAQ